MFFFSGIKMAAFCLRLSKRNRLVINKCGDNSVGGFTFLWTVNVVGSMMSREDLPEKKRRIKF